MSEFRHDPLDDGISTLEYVDHMGTDSSVVRAARVSYAGDGENFEAERDAKLIRYLADNQHGTPFEHTAITLHVAAPIFVIRQWHRHRIGFSYNEVSRRYTSEDIEIYVPKEWRKQNKSGNKQGSFGGGVNEVMTNLYRDTCMKSVERYWSFLNGGIANEQARMILPQSLYTRMYVTGNLRSWAHFYGLRADEHAQQEIRVYAEAVGEIIGRLFPVSWNALAGGTP